MGRFAGIDAGAFFHADRAVDRDAADGCLGFFLDALFGFSGAVPMAEEETTLLDFNFELFPSVDFPDPFGPINVMISPLLIPISISLIRGFLL